MSPRRRPLRARVAAACTGALLALSGCGGGLDPPTLVKTPRVLAMIVDHPESAPGTDLTVRVVAHDPRSRALAYRWSLCLSPENLVGASLSGADAPDDTCLEQPGTTDTLTIPGTLTSGLLAQLDALPDTAGSSRAVVLAILDSAGLAFEVRVDVCDGPCARNGDNVLVSGTKRAALTRRTPLTTNPPNVSFLVGETPVTMGLDPLAPGFACAVWGPPITVASGARLTLAPEPDETWLERYPIYAYSGDITEGVENAYYSWYATDGRSDETTRPPERDATFLAPTLEAGETSRVVRLWSVVRDGHLGARACFLDLTVVPARE